MRARKNREVNIFSASVVDLFASGLGVFLIVSIIALVNQKKESAKNQKEKSIKSFATQGTNQDIRLLETKVEKLKKEVFTLKLKNLENKNISHATQKETELKIEHEVEKSKLLQQSSILEKQVTKLKSELKEQSELVTKLNYHLENQSSKIEESEKSAVLNFSQFEVGSKIKLENVQFYPGTDRTIEPYASREIKEFSLYMDSNPKVMIEVSGHIFETKKAIESGKADDEYNLSGMRAKAVCDILEDFGVSRKRLQCVGYGAERSIHLTNDQYSKEAQMNRRVEIEILSK